MKAIVQYFSNIWYFITTIAKFIWHTISNIGIFIDYANEINTFVLEFIDTMPTFIQYFALLTLLISILFVLLGRAGGKSS